MKSHPFNSLVSLFSDNHIKTIFFDADDTLWHDRIYFQQLIDFLFKLGGSLGKSKKEIRSYLLYCLKKTSGEKGFADAILETANFFKFSEGSVQLLKKEIDLFENHPISVFSFVKESLESLSDYKKILVTKGNRHEQITKLKKSLLKDYFDEIIIREKKNSQELKRLMLEFNVKRKEAMLIGNSIKEDIIPAVENGVYALWLNHANNYHGRDGIPPGNIVEIENWKIIYNAITNKKNER